MNITDIPIGRENAITREELMRKTGLSDRTIRREIECYRRTLPEDGYIVMSTSHGTGYWRTNDKDEIDQFIGETICRTNNTRKPAIIAMQVLNNIGQVRMDGC